MENTEVQKTKITIPNLNQDPLLDLDHSAAYTGYSSGRSFSVILSRGTYPLLNQNVIYIGRRPHFRISTLESFLKSRSGSELAK